MHIASTNSWLLSVFHSVTLEFLIIFIFGLETALSYIIFEALKILLRFIIVTRLANLVRNIASSIAESPPPTTTISSSLKKAPSHVAHVDIPRPFNACSPLAFSHKDLAPVAIIIDFVNISCPSVVLTQKG